MKHSVCCMVWAFLSMLAVVATPLSAEESTPLDATVGVKVWALRVQYHNEEESQSEEQGTLWGPTLKVDLPWQLWFSGFYLQGSADYSGVYAGLSVDQRDWEALIGRNFGYLAVGVGYRQHDVDYSWDIEADHNGGPVFHVGTGTIVWEDASVGLYAGATWMFHATDEWTKGEHYNVEGGVYVPIENLTLLVGYRYHDYYRQDNGLVYQGFTLGASYTF